MLRCPWNVWMSLSLSLSLLFLLSLPLYIYICVSQHAQAMSLDESLANRKLVIENLFRLLRNPDEAALHLLSLSVLRILTRDTKNLEMLFTPDRIETMLHMANLVGEEEAYMTDSCSDFDSKIVVESLKCLCNLVYNNHVIQRMCCHNSTLDGIMLRMKMYKDPQLPSEVKYFDMRLLFLLTALCPDVRPRVRNEYHGLIYLMEAIDLIVKSTQDPSERNMKKSLRKRKGSSRTARGSNTAGSDSKGSTDAGATSESTTTPQPPVTPDPSTPTPSASEDTSNASQGNPSDLAEVDPTKFLTDDEVNLVVEVLKVLFNLTCSFDRKAADEVEEAHLMRLVAILHDLLLCETKNRDRKDEIQSHTVNLLTSMPESAYDELIVPVEEIGKIDNPIYEYEDFNVEAIAVLIEFLDKRLSPPEQPIKSMHETLAPILLCLTAMSRSKRIIRKYLRSRILPPLREVHQRPEEGNTIRNKLVKLMTTPNTEVKELVADFLFVLCKESVARLIKYTGYGNAAGLLARRGLMLGGKRSDNYSSESEDSETEEYAAYKDKINPVIGCTEESKGNPMEGMTEEQKEYEAMKLVNTIDQMMREGIVRPCKIGDDGKPHPVDHVCELVSETTTLATTSKDKDEDSE